MGFIVVSRQIITRATYAVPGKSVDELKAIDSLEDILALPGVECIEDKEVDCTYEEVHQFSDG